MVEDLGTEGSIVVYSSFEQQRIGATLPGVFPTWQSR